MIAWPWLTIAVLVAYAAGAIDMNLRWTRWLKSIRRPKPSPYIERTPDHDDKA